MRRSVETIYGLGRLAFGGSVMVAPEALGGLIFGAQAREPAVRASFRFYGTRDVVLGLGTLRAVADDGNVSAWLAAGIASDVLDVAVQLAEWNDLPPSKRIPGVLAAAGAAGAGAWLLARR